ncbi:MAG: GNAT family N-acetyltransferase [Desulfobacterales bacterium]|nr:GNAT family N-acetyltransferase [Desulfobacterales bacterium]
MLTACLDWIFTRPDVSRAYAVVDTGNTASRRVMEKLGMRHETDVDLYQSVAEGEGLLPLYTIQREAYLRQGIQV